MPSALEDANALFGFAHATYDAGEDIGNKLGNKPCTVLAYRMSETVTEAMLRFAFGTLDIETRSISVHQSDVDKFAFVCLSSTEEAREVLKQFCRFTPSKFDELYELIESKITVHKSTHLRPIKGKERLVTLLRYLRLGCSFSALSHEFKIGKQTAGKIVGEMARLVNQILVSDWMPMPTAQTWVRNEVEFRALGFPMAVGAIDGKHFWCKQPMNSGSLNFNYKGFYSIVMLALVDASSRFLLVEVGAAGRNSDSTLYQSSPIRVHIEERSEIPAGRPLGNVGEMPHVILADGGFGLADYMMTPFPTATTNTNERSLYNTRLSSARRVVENAFGQLCNRFHLFFRIMEVNPEKARDLIFAATLLHNFLGPDPAFEETSDVIALVDQNQQRTPAATRRARIIRDKFVQYFSS